MLSSVFEDGTQAAEGAQRNWDEEVNSLFLFAGETRKERILFEFANFDNLSAADLTDSSKVVQYHHLNGNYEYFSDNYVTVDPSGNIIEFMFDRCRWKTAQHAYQAFKFLDPESREIIRQAESSQRAKELATEMERIGQGDRDPEFLAEHDGVANNVRLMFRILWAKFSQSRRLSAALLHTHWRAIVHRFDASDFWGCREEAGGVRGANWNGKILMVIREMLRERGLREEDSWPPLAEALARMEPPEAGWVPEALTEEDVERRRETGAAITFDSRQERPGHRNDHFFLSDNYPCDLEYLGETWPSAQHAYQAAKFSKITAAGRAVRAAIRAAPTPREAKVLGIGGGAGAWAKSRQRPMTCGSTATS